MKKKVLNYLVIVALVVSTAFMLSMVACGGGSGKIPNGTYEIAWGQSYIFSGNKFKKMYKGEMHDEGTYKLVEEYKEKGFRRGVIIFNSRKGEDKGGYRIEGNKFNLNGDIYTKK